MKMKKKEVARKREENIGEHEKTLSGHRTVIFGSYLQD